MEGPIFRDDGSMWEDHRGCLNMELSIGECRFNGVFRAISSRRPVASCAASRIFPFLILDFGQAFAIALSSRISILILKKKSIVV